MSTPHQHSRKNFLIKLFGIGAAAGVLPGIKAFARHADTARQADIARTDAPDKKAPFVIRRDARAIARTDAG